MTFQHKYLPVVFLLTIIVICSPSSACALGLVKITLKVVDEKSYPIQDAQVETCLYGGCLTKDAIHGVTDSDGNYSVSGSSFDGLIGGGVRKEGYYTSVFHNSFIRKNFGTWQPWNKEITVVLRPIVNPVPMYVRNRSFEIPEHNKEIGFDLMKADWVIPYGQGTQADFIVKVEMIYNNIDDYDATLTMTFPNPYDGIQLYKEDPGGIFDVGSWYRLPRNAPSDGYKNTLTIRKATSSRGYYARETEDENHIFRVRSEVDEDGKLKRAMYGKIRNGFKFHALAGENHSGSIKMHYYLNPDYTRNLEFDPKRNLFTSLPEMEGVAQP